MRVHALYHVPFENVGSMAAHLAQSGHPLVVTRLYNADPLPDLTAFDLLVVMGGPMGVHDDTRHPWLAAEKRFLRVAMAQGKTILGICLGAQLLASVAGADVTRNPHREIGWFPVTRSAVLETTRLRDLLPSRFDAFHWHGDTFDLPAGAIPIGSSEACLNQGFIIDDRIVGLQFHLETTPQSAAALIEHCGHELDGSRFVQDTVTMLSQPDRFHRLNTLMAKLLDALTNP
jgi:GMP synthase-like glutamine amidotransferase